MSLRAALLRAMLGALLVACASAMVSIFSWVGSDLPARFTGTTSLIAVACAIVLPVLPRDETYRFTLSGLVWIGIVGYQTTIGMILIWAELFPSSIVCEEALGFAIGVLPFSFATILIPLKQIERSKGSHHRASVVAVSILGLITVVIEAALLANGFVTGSFQDLGEIMLVWMILMGGGIVGSACAAGLFGTLRLWRRCAAIAGLLFTVVAVGYWIAAIYSNVAPIPHIISYAFVASGFAVALGVITIGGVLPLGRAERRLAPVLAALTAIVGLIAADFAKNGAVDPWTRQLLSATVILDFCVGLAIVILYRIGRKSAGRLWSISGADLACPRCGKRSTFATGEHPCPQCGFHVLIAFRDERCARCKHDVRHLPSGNPCPECGLAVENTASSYTPIQL